MTSDKEEISVCKRTRGRSDATEESPAKRLKAELERELEEDEKKMGFSSPPPTMNSLGGWNSLTASTRKEKEEKPAELFRKDLISAMKMADSESLQPDEYFGILDPWRQEWERGVQVPVHDELLHEPSTSVIEGYEKFLGPYSFKLPKKYLHAQNDENYKQGIHELHDTQTLAEQVCRYDLDDLDTSWLSIANEHFADCGLPLLQEWEMERILEEIEAQCYSNMQQMIKTVEGLGIEYDENVVCDVCRSPDGEDGNEMVFCDACDICVHQACYGIQKVPEGSWLCRTCALGIKPMCILCPRKGGAMKSTKSGTKWSHVSCALWIPEVSIGVPEKMEPITKISQIPSSRWSLICSLCRERSGACIQCCVKACSVAFHVTCAFSHGLDMKTVLDESAQDVQLKAFCLKHTKKKDGGASPGKTTSTPRKESEMTEQEKTELRSHRLAKLAEEFYTCVKPSEVAEALKLDPSVVDFVHAFWVLKRKSVFSRPLLMPKREEADLLTKQREDSLIARMKMFIHLRQDLERVRNLCYMVSRREKVRRQLHRLKEEIFHKQTQLIEEDPAVLARSGTRDHHAVVSAHKMPADESIYDQHDGILTMARLADREWLEAVPQFLNPPRVKSRGPGRPPKRDKALKLGESRLADINKKSVSEAGRSGETRVSDEASGNGSPRDDDIKVKPKTHAKESEKGRIKDQSVKPDEDQEVEKITSRGLRSSRAQHSPASKSSSPVAAKSPSHGSQSPRSLAASPNPPGSKSPVYGSSAPQMRSLKSPIVKNLFESIQMSMAKGEFESPDLAYVKEESEEEEEEQPRKRELRSRTVVTPVNAEATEEEPKMPKLTIKMEHVPEVKDENDVQSDSRCPVLRSRVSTPIPDPIIITVDNANAMPLLKERHDNAVLSPPKSRSRKSNRGSEKHSAALNGIIGDQSLVVSRDIRERVQQRLGTGCRKRLSSGQRKIDQFFQKKVSESPRARLGSPRRQEAWKEAWSPRRATRLQAESDMESEASSYVSESPSKVRRSLAQKSSPGKRLLSRFSGRSTPAESESSATQGNSESEYAPSEADAVEESDDGSIGQRLRSRLSREHLDETSRDSSMSSYSARSRSRSNALNAR